MDFMAVLYLPQETCTREKWSVLNKCGAFCFILNIQAKPRGIFQDCWSMILFLVILALDKNRFPDEVNNHIINILNDGENKEQANI